MNELILEKIGKFIDQNYISNYKIEGYFGFAYLTVYTGEGDKLIFHYYLVGDEVVRELKQNVEA